MNTTLTIQEKLKDLRVEHGLTLEQLADQTGLSKSALGNKYILAKKHDHSRISKRMEKALKKQQFPRLWTSCVIIKEIERWGGLA